MSKKKHFSGASHLAGASRLPSRAEGAQSGSAGFGPSGPGGEPAGTRGAETVAKPETVTGRDRFGVERSGTLSADGKTFSGTFACDAGTMAYTLPVSSLHDVRPV